MPTEAQRVLEFAKATFATTDMVLTQPDEFTMTQSQEAAFLQDAIDAPGSLVLIAETSSTGGCGAPTGLPEILGMLSLKQGSRRRSAHTTYLGMMVHASWRGVGIGDALLTHAVAFARSVPELRRVTLEVSAENQAGLALYRKHGFAVEGVMRGHFQRCPGVFDDILCMACDVVTA